MELVLLSPCSEQAADTLEDGEECSTVAVYVWEDWVQMYINHLHHSMREGIPLTKRCVCVCVCVCGGGGGGTVSVCVSVCVSVSVCECGCGGLCFSRLTIIVHDFQPETELFRFIIITISCSFCLLLWNANVQYFLTL